MIRLRATLVVAAALAAGCAPGAAPRIACVGSNSTAVAAARLAVEDVNQAGGVRGHALGLVVVVDGGSGGAKAVAEAESLVRDPSILAVVGHGNSAASVAAAQVYNRAGLPQIAPTASAPVYGDAGRFSFRMIPDDRRQAEFLARQIAGAARLGVAIVYGNDDYGRGLRSELRLRLALRQVAPRTEIAMHEPSDSVEQALLVASLERARPGVIVWIGQPPGLAAVLPRLRRRLPEVQVWGSDAFDSPYTFGLERNLAGLRFVRFVDPLAGDPRIQNLRRRFRAATGLELTYGAVLAYDAVALVAEGLRRGARNRGELQRFLAQLRRPGFPGVGGAVAFDARRDADRPYLLAEVVADTVRAVQPR